MRYPCIASKLDSVELSVFGLVLSRFSDWKQSSLKGNEVAAAAAAALSLVLHLLQISAGT